VPTIPVAPTTATFIFSILLDCKDAKKKKDLNYLKRYKSAKV
jgi:hypothetical protein